MTHSVLITGAGSGIGRGLAEAFHRDGWQVIAAGRSLGPLDELLARCPGVLIEHVDVASAASVAACAARVAVRCPSLAMVVNNAGVQRELDFASPDRLTAAQLDEEIDINLKGLIRVSHAFLPLLMRQPEARLVHIGSALAYVPLASTPIYSATKAAVHSFTVSLRRQLRGTSVRVVEIMPPVVETGLHDGQSRVPPNAMPLSRFVEQAMKGLDAGRDEVHVGLAKVLRVASRVAPGLFLNVVNKSRG